MANITINEKTSKQDIIKYLLGCKTDDKNLAERIVYALEKVQKDVTKVAKADLFELAQEVMGKIAPAPAAPVEASLKAKSSGKKEETKSSGKSSGKTSSKLKANDKKEKTDSKVKTNAPLTTKGADFLPSAILFPETIEHPELGTLVSCKDEFKDYESVVAAINEGQTLYFACYWTQRHIKEYGYAASHKVAAPKGGFLFDLDLAQAVLPCENIERLYCMSTYTEALYMFEGEDFAPIEDKDPRTGDTFSIRVCAGMEYEIYRLAESGESAE